MKARNKNPIILLFQWLHVKIYQLSGGRFGTKLLAMPILILSSTGRKTGKTRDRALTYAHVEGDYYVVASNGGSDLHPNWWINLKSQPKAEINVEGQNIMVHAQELSGNSRQMIWNRFVDMEDRYLTYEKICKRTIPVVCLSPNG